MLRPWCRLRWSFLRLRPRFQSADRLDHAGNGLAADHGDIHEGDKGAGAFAKSGVGIAVGEFTVGEQSSQTVVDGIGVSLTFGVGADVPIWRSLALTANGGVWFSAIGDIVLPNTRVDDVIATLYSINIGFAIR